MVLILNLLVEHILASLMLSTPNLKKKGKPTMLHEVAHQLGYQDLADWLEQEATQRAQRT